MNKSEEIEALLSFAIQIAHEAGHIGMRYFRTDLEVLNKSNAGFFDPVTDADKEIERFLRAKISERFPEHNIIGEEEGVSGGGESYTWFIDPIDGTRGFITGSPMWGILIGLMDGENCVAGLMHQPYTKETYIGSSEGAFVLTEGGKKQISSSDQKHISDSVMCSTHHLMFDNDRDMKVFHSLVNSSRFSRFGTDCYGYTLLAMGFVDFVLEANLALYDIVPLIPVIEASGGIVTDWNGQPAHQGGNIIASSNFALHEEILALIKQTH